MSSDFQEYLTTEVISEQRTLSYRNVSRALKVHVNAAKCMLYEFYEQENKRNPGSVYSTYLICGVKKPQAEVIKTNGTTNGVHSQHDGESMPASSPPQFTSSMLEPSQQQEEDRKEESTHIPIHTITLVGEEKLQAIQELYESITSLHMYSVSPSRIADLVALTDTSRQLLSSTFAEGSEFLSKIYGTIQNPKVRKRKGKRPIGSQGPALTPVTKDEPKSIKTKAENLNSTKDELTRPNSQDAAPATIGKQPNLKRDGSDFFKFFSKNKVGPKLERNDTDASANASGSGVDDTKMTDADEEGESEDEALFLDTNTTKPSTKKRTSDVQREREDRAAKLRKMMDSDEEEESALPNVEDASGIKIPPVVAKKGGEQAETRNDEKDEVAWSDSDTERQRENAVGKDQSINKVGDQTGTTTAPQRRRGKRKVMKKRTMKDEEGYLVTKEEAVWESFSEDEPESTRDRPKPMAAKSQNMSQSQKGATGKGGAAGKGGNIMNFFGKK